MVVTEKGSFELQFSIENRFFLWYRNPVVELKWTEVNCTLESAWKGLKFRILMF
jgi:hypothetical protein